MRLNKKFLKRGTAVLLSAAMLAGTIMANAGGWTQGGAVTIKYGDITLSDETKAELERYGRGYMTGLTLENTSTDETLGYNGPEITGYSKFWLDDHGAREADMTLKGSQAAGVSATIHVDFSKIADQYVSCIADHTGDASISAFNDWGLGTAAIHIFFPTDYIDDYPKFIRDACGGDMARMKFNLLLTSMIHARHGKVSDSDLKDPINDTAYSVLMYCLVRAIDQHTGFMGTSADEDYRILTSNVNWADEIRSAFAPNKNGDMTVWNELNGESIKKYFTECWEIAKFLSNFTFTADSATINFVEGTNESGQISMTYDYSGLDEVSKKYFQAVKVNGDVEGYLNDGSKIVVTADTQEEMDQLKQTVTFYVDSSVLGSNLDIAPSGLIGLKLLGFNVPAGVSNSQEDLIFIPKNVLPVGQERFAAYQQELTIPLIPGNPPGGGGGTPDPDPEEWKVEVTRYKHTEQFTATYNVNLRKFDSETGQPLEGATFDILEAFDDSQLSGTSLESLENWQNESGSQFDTWDGWDYGPGNQDGDSANDPCDVDNDETNEDGLLTNAAVGDTAHTDVKTYIYTKGYCGGHPKPDTSGLDDDEAEAAMEAWQEEVDKCEDLVAEGGFFHSVVEGEAQKQMEADRDEYYKQFISLTYDYSAAEVEARDGYILHGTHTDDIPIETKTVTSSELKTYNSNGNTIPHTGGSETGGDDEAETESLAADVSGFKASTANRIDTDAMATDSEPTMLSLSYNTELSASTKLSEEGDYYDPAEFETEDEDADDSDEEDVIEDIEILADDDTAASNNKTNDKDDDKISVASRSDAQENTSRSFVSKKRSTEDDSDTDVASGSEANSEDKISFLESLFVGAKDVVSDIEETGKSIFERAAGLFKAGDDDADEDEGDTGSGAGSVSHPVRDATTFVDSIANRVDPLEDSIVDHTFTVFDHRTEGEIHINKRDFNLSNVSNDEGDDFDSYAQENADGSLEGAVYGLFAANAIEHPDGKTGTVYEKGDLVAVATTDRNGDASFMVFTEAPGHTYDYKTGKIVETENGWADAAPKNLHQNQADGDAHANSDTEDNEAYIGFDSKNQKVTLTDSEAGDDTVYSKHSSNQEGIEGLEGGYETYPISNNEDNNGNCWIGRPLIAADGGSQYYVKELSRSEGYELSVNGKTNEITNGAGSEEHEYEAPDVTVSSVQYDQAEDALYITVTAENAASDVHLKTNGMTEGASFAISTTDKQEVTQDVVKKEAVEVPVIGTEGDFVYLNGSRVEASVGDKINVNGTEYTVNQVSDPEVQRTGAFPINTRSYGTTSSTTYGVSDFNAFMDAYNAELADIGYKEPDPEAPWAKIELMGSTDTDWIISVTRYITNNGLHYFNRMRIKEIIQEGGRNYAMLQYDYGRYGDVYDSIYNPDANAVLVRKDTRNGYFVYVPYAIGSAQVLSYQTDDTGFVTSASLQAQDVVCNVTYPGALPDSYTMRSVLPKTYWVYDGQQQKFNNDGTLATTIEWKEVTEQITYEQDVEVLTPVTATFDEQYDITIPASAFGEDGTVKIKIYAENGSDFTPLLNQYASVYYSPTDGNEDSYIKNVTLFYESEDIIISDGGTTVTPADLYERPIRQKIKVSKDIQTLAEPKVVWYCLNCGNENQDGTAACGFCGTERTTEETKTIRYAHDTYSAVHKENISAGRDAGIFDTVTDWLTSLMGGTEENDSAADIPNFRFKAYLKSNLERLYRDEDGNVIWMDRNGNTITPQYEDTNGDGNYDTFTWKYDEAYDGKTVDFPEKDIVSDDGTLESANVQKIYTKVKHVEDSDTTSAQANNVWSDYEDPQSGATENAGEKNGYSTSLRETADGESGDLSGMAVRVNDALYSYDGKNTNTDETDRINDGQNSGYTRILETRRVTMEDNDATREVEMYNYEKFFDAIAAANADIWDDDMHSTFTGDSMANYPGQHWFETFYEKYQKDDADPDHTLENTDGADADNTAGGDRDTSFKPFRWIRENVFGDRDDYEKYPAEHNGENTEVTTSTSDFAKANAEASDAVRQFATKWYLEDEAAKLMTANGLGEDIAKDNNGEIEYDEAVYDEALFNAIAKAYNYLRPFYVYDLDTIYSVEWDSESDGGADNDYTTLSIDNDGGEEYYNISGYLPYGTYVIVEQQPQRIDDSINDWENRSYTIEKPKEVILPAVYDAEASNDTTDNYDTHYNYSYTMDLQDQAASDNYLIRFGEEWPHNNSQDEREYVIRAHNYFGDFEVYKYGLDIDKLQDTITYDGGDYAYAGFGITQEEFDPLKDYYETTHRGEAGVPEIGKENGGNDNSHLYAIDKTDGDDTANGTTYEGDQLEDCFFYGSISEDAGIADNVMYKGGTVDDNNASGMQWKDGVRAMTGELTAYEGKYASMLVPWTVTAPADLDAYSSDDFSGYADVNMRDGFFTTTLRVNKVDSETGEYILHDNAIFALYAGSRYQSFEEIEEDAKLIEDPEEKAMFLEQFKPGDAKFYLQDTVITGSREFLMAMGAKDITKAARGRSGVVESGTGAGELYSGTVPKGTPICLESERIMLTDEIGARTGQMTVYTTLADVLAEAEDGSGKREYINQNIGWFETPQPIGAGVYVLAEIKAPAGYARSKPVAYEVYSDGTYYYPDGDMYGKVKAVRYEKNLIEDFEYQE